jgi:hypothetical protein
MYQYNTRQSQLILPEYGRNIQNMVDYCLTIEDREERTRCAFAIVHFMQNLFPSITDRKTLWDHLNVMAGFNLDVDFPVEVIDREQLNPKPEPLPYSDNRMRWRHYGRNIELMIRKVADMEECEDKEKIISMIAHQMKKLQLVHNKEGVDDSKILRDLAIYSEGKINLDPETYLLHEFREAPAPATSKKKKKKK